MKKVFSTWLLLLSVFALSAQSSALTQTIRGVVVDEQSGHTLAWATVKLEGGTASAITDTTGSFRLKNIPLGRQAIRISLTGYEEVVIPNIEVTSSHEVVLELRIREKVQKLEEVVLKAGKQKNRAINEMATVSARQLSMDEAVRYAGTRNDPSRMAQNFAGVSGSNDARNDIIIRGNSPSGVLWRMEGIDIPNPNHYSTLGSTGGPVTILNTNTLKSSDFITSAFPAQYGNALAGVFDLRMRNGNNEKYEFLGQMGFNGFEFGAEGPLSRTARSSFLVNYRYSLIAAVQKLGLSVGTGNATPYYQDVNFKVNIPTKKAGVFSLFGRGGESHISFEAHDDKNLYSTTDGSLRDRNFKSLTGVTGITHTYFFNPTTSGRFMLAASGFDSRYEEIFFNKPTPDNQAFYKKNVQVKLSAGYTLNKKFSSRNQFTAGIISDRSKLRLRMDYIPNGDSVLQTFFNTKQHVTLLRGFANLGHRFSDKLSTNFGLYYQFFTLNDKQSIEPRWNIKYQFSPGRSLSFGAGLHSQAQPLEVYYYETKNSSGEKELTNKNLDFVKSVHTVLGYDMSFSKNLRFKAEVYGQYIYDAATEQLPSSFSMLNSGADFYFPDKTNLVNGGKGYNYGMEMTLERFLHKGFYYLVTVSLFNSRYTGSDEVWRNTAFNTRYVTNILGGKEFAFGKNGLLGIDTKLAIAGGQPYTPFDITASEAAGYVVFKENEAFSLRNDAYLRWDLKFSYTRNGRKTTQKWYVDLQNITGRENIYIRTLNPKSGAVDRINQIGFFPNINYQVTF
ncbi:MAG: TonB-dependent receptor [Chitinophagaceae bacterium]|nr:TonB-dependent receptor [Chitinophagaceae bacterium]